MLANGNGAPSLSDIAAVAGRNNNDDAFGGNNGWWILIILFAIFGGWGNGGWQNNNQYPANTGYIDAAIQRGFDNQTVVSKLNGLENGICSLGYDQLAQMNNINQTISTTGYNVLNAIQQNSIAGLQNTNTLQSQIQTGFCGVNESVAQNRYDLASGTCAITNAVTQASQNIMNNDNANYRQLHDEITAIQMSQKDEKIADLQAQVQQLNLTASQQAQNNYIVSHLQTPAPIPSFSVPNPFAGYYGYQQNGCCGSV